ncbi:MAG: hypothetical protein IJM83_00370 [Firmicutes bacterium]|nr:hypothetical protein [Bacillota bacterium]
MAILKFDIPSETMGRQVTFEAIIPAEAMLDGEEIAVLYLLHGVQGGYINWISLTNAMRLLGQRNLQTDVGPGKARKRLALIMPSGGNGFYHPIPSREERQENMGHQHDYEAFLAEELPAWTRKMLPVSKAREDMGIAGLSMGGYGALYLGIKYGETFGFAGGLSSALLTQRSLEDNFAQGQFFRAPEFLDLVFGGFDDHRAENDVFRLSLKARARERREELPDGTLLPKLYLACGEQDPLLELSKELHTLWDKARIPHTFETHPGAHEWAFWEWGLERMLRIF